MGIWGFGDNSDFKLIVKPSDHKPELFHWLIKDSSGKIRALPPVAGQNRGFSSYQAAEADARDFIRGLGADFNDLEVIEE